jgi:hypothetical protein
MVAFASILKVTRFAHRMAESSGVRANDGIVSTTA